GIKAGYTLDGVPTHRRAHIHSHSLTQSHTTDNLEMPINLPCMSLDWGRKPPRHGENMQTPHTRRRRESNPQPWRCEANVLTTKPPYPLLLYPPPHGPLLRAAGPDVVAVYPSHAEQVCGGALRGRSSEVQGRGRHPAEPTSVPPGHSPPSPPGTRVDRHGAGSPGSPLPRRRSRRPVGVGGGFSCVLARLCGGKNKGMVRLEEGNMKCGVNTVPSW
ncbi:hypothetical protein QTP86_030107, partial [Hemibagrus guttatus]